MSRSRVRRQARRDGGGEREREAEVTGLRARARHDGGREISFVRRLSTGSTMMNDRAGLGKRNIGPASSPSPSPLPLLLLLVLLLRRQASRAIFAATPVFSRRVIYGRPLRDGAIEFLK